MPLTEGAALSGRYDNKTSPLNMLSEYRALGPVVSGIGCPSPNVDWVS